jgi:hypothetical protein
MRGRERRRKRPCGSIHCARNPIPSREAMVDFGEST